MSDMYRRKAYMYFNFQQNRVSRSAKTVHINLFAKITSCINLQLPIVIKKKYFRQASSDNVHTVPPSVVVH